MIIRQKYTMRLRFTLATLFTPITFRLTNRQTNVSHQTLSPSNPIHPVLIILYCIVLCMDCTNVLLSFAESTVITSLPNSSASTVERDIWPYETPAHWTWHIWIRRMCFSPSRYVFYFIFLPTVLPLPVPTLSLPLSISRSCVFSMREICAYGKITISRRQSQTQYRRTCFVECVCWLCSDCHAVAFTARQQCSHST